MFVNATSKTIYSNNYPPLGLSFFGGGGGEKKVWGLDSRPGSVSPNNIERTTHTPLSNFNILKFVMQKYIKKLRLLVGLCVGLSDGLLVGTSVGCGLGDWVGTSVGGLVAGVGSTVGDNVGVGVGDVLGSLVGESVGCPVGSSVGSLVGFRVGLLVGRTVGSSVGLLVGDIVGSSVWQKKEAQFETIWANLPQEATHMMFEILLNLLKNKYNVFWGGHRFPLPFTIWSSLREG